MAAKCHICTKTAYPMESLLYQERNYHKACFKCQAPVEGGSCGIALTLKTANGRDGIIYCKNHFPTDKPTSVTTEGSMSMSLAKNAPKVATFNKEKRGDSMEKPIQVAADQDYHVMHAKETHRPEIVNKEKRCGDERNLQVADMATTRAMEAPKIDTVNVQVRGELAGQRNAQVADMATTRAMEAPKIDTVNVQVRGELAGQRNAQVADMTLQTALEAPKVETVNVQVRGELAGQRNAQVADLTLQNAIDAPKIDTVNQQIRLQSDAVPDESTIVRQEQAAEEDE